MNQLDYDGPLFDTDAVAEALLAAPLGPEAARRKAGLFRQAAQALKGGGQPVAFFVPGRVEVLGKHTDYAGGRSMVIAAEQGFACTAVGREDERVIVHAVSPGETVDFAIDPDLVPRLGHWSNYPMTVVRRAARNFAGGLRGVEIALAADLPPAAGMSSSSALMVAVFLLLDAINGLVERPEYRRNIQTPADLAGYLGTVENGQTFRELVGDRGVGTFGGSEDHTAILCGRAEQLTQFAYCPVRFERAVPLPSSHAFAIAASGVVAEKTGGALERYNAASRSAAVLAELWRKATGRDEPHLAAIVQSEPDAADRLREIVRSSSDERFSAAMLSNRLEQFVLENEELIPRAADALAGGELEGFGTEVRRSQRAAEQLLRNQVPETVFLARVAQELGATAASAFGAGFGGSVWALVEKSEVDRFLDEWKAGYERQFPEPAAGAEFFATTPGPAAFRVA